MPHFIRLVLFPFLFLLGIPLVLSLLLDVPVVSTLALVAAALVIEYGAVAPAIALGLDLPFSLAVISLVCFGILVTSYEVFTLLSISSARVREFLNRMDGIRSTRILRRYGILALVPGMAIVGFYVCPAAAWIIGWDKRAAILVMYGGFLISSLAVAFITLGILPVLPVPS